jgi:hypothetical protein
MSPTCSQARCAPHAVVALLVAGLAGCAAKPPDFAAGSIEVVEIKLSGLAKRQKAAEIRSTDAAQITALLDVLRSAVATRDHKCANSGQIALSQKEKGEVRIGILAGHDEQHYEFRLYRGGSYDIFQVERAPFLKAMADLGAGELDLGEN